jgi:ATP-dependent DNA helicase RecQ
MNKHELTMPADPINKAAKEVFGIDYVFPYQRLVISNILEAAGVEGFAALKEPGRIEDRTEGADTRPHQIVILPTGAGKSLCFMLPAAMLPGPTLVVFPLLSLITDQARRVVEAGMQPGVLKGGQSEAERNEVWKGVEEGDIRILLTNPETALAPAVLDKMKTAGVTHLVIDETHIAADWGDTFRPVYKEIAGIHRQAGIPIVTAFTATASDHILARVKQIVFPDSSPHTIAANPDRVNINYRVLPSICKSHDLVRLIGGEPGRVRRPAIIFCRSRVSAELTARTLRARLDDESIFFYHAGLSKEEKASTEKWFFESSDGVLAATCAYGMGVDKGDVRTVLHRDMPPSVEAYLQESGRAGRDRGPAEALLLFGPEDWRTLLRRRRRYEPDGKEDLARRRYLAMLGYASSGATCRRQYLLSLLQAEPDVCFGCDVCRGDLISTPTGLKEILHFVSRHPRTFTVKDGALILAGWMSRDTVGRRLYAVRGFGALADWLPSEIEEAFASLLSVKLLAIPRHGAFKNRVRMASTRVYQRGAAKRISLLHVTDGS